MTIEYPGLRHDVIEILHKQRLSLRALAVTASGTQSQTPPWAFTQIHLRFTAAADGLGAEQLTRAIDLSLNKYCSVRASLRPEIEVTFEGGPGSHTDHHGGLLGLLARLGPRRLPLILHPDCWRDRKAVFPNGAELHLPAPTLADLEQEGVDVLEHRDPSLVLDGQVLVTGQVARVTTFEHTIGQPLAHFYPPEEVAAGLPATALATTATTGRYAGEGWRVRQDGSRLLRPGREQTLASPEAQG